MLLYNYYIYIFLVILSFESDLKKHNIKILVTKLDQKKRKFYFISVYSLNYVFRDYCKYVLLDK